MATEKEKEMYPLIIEVDGDKYITHLEGFIDAVFSNPLVAFDEAIKDIANYASNSNANKVRIAEIDNEIIAYETMIQEREEEKKKLQEVKSNHPLAGMVTSKYRYVFRAMCKILEAERTGLEKQMNMDIGSIFYKPIDTGMGFTWFFGVREFEDGVPIEEKKIGVTETP